MNRHICRYLFSGERETTSLRLGNKITQDEVISTAVHRQTYLCRIAAGSTMAGFAGKWPYLQKAGRRAPRSLPITRATLALYLQDENKRGISLNTGNKKTMKLFRLNMNWWNENWNSYHTDCCIHTRHKQKIFFVTRNPNFNKNKWKLE